MCGEPMTSISMDFIAERLSAESQKKLEEAERRFAEMVDKGEIFALAPLERFSHRCISVKDFV